MKIFPAPISSTPSNTSGNWLQWFELVFKAILSLGGLNKVVEASATLDFPNIAAAGVQTLTLTVTGARVNATNIPRVIVSTTPINGVIFDGYVSADDEVTIRAMNYTAGGINPASQLYCVTVFMY